MAIKRMIHRAEVNLEFRLEPAVSQWALASESGDGLHTAYEGDGYTLILEEEHGEGHTLVTFSLRRDSGEPFTLHQYVLETEISMVDLDRVWIPGRPGSYGQQPAEWIRLFKNQASTVTSADRRMPILIGMNRAGITKLAAGFLDQRIETELRHIPTTHLPAKDQDRGRERFRLQRPIEGYSLGRLTEYHDAIFLSSGASWFDTLHTYRAVYDAKTGGEFRPSPDISWEPVWAPWGVPKGKWDKMRFEELTSAEFLEMAEVAADLGFKATMGWMVFWDVPDRSKMRDDYWGWPDTIGDYTPGSEYKDLKEVVQKLKALGIRAIPWFNPWMAGHQTKVHEELKEALIDVDIDRSVASWQQPNFSQYEVCTSYLCPRNPITQKHVVELVTRMIEEYDFDGFTLDMVDSMPLIPCTAKHEHNYPTVGLAMAAGLDSLREVAQALKPDFHIEFRTRYSNIYNLYNATAHRSHDSGDVSAYDANRQQCVFLRSYVPPGVAVHYDPVWWHIEEKNETVAKMLSTMVVSGVPQVCADIVNMTDDHRRLVKGWLDFYQEHKEDFRYGQLRPVQHDVLFSTIKVERGRKAFVSYASFPALKVPLSPEAEEIYLFNCTNGDSLYTILLNVKGEFSATVHNYDLSPLSEAKVKGRDRALLVDLGVPQGGYIALRKADQ